MSILLVGGHDRMHREYKNIVADTGHKIKIFTQLPANFEKRIGCPDVIVIFTNTVSHKMLRTAEKEAKRHKIPVYKSHTSSATSLNKMITCL